MIMQLKRLIAALKKYFALWFHKRNIIIVSEHKVKHIPISGGVQCIALLMMVSCICWASYSTGRFIAARSALKEQNQTLRAVASERSSSFGNKLSANKPMQLATDLKPQIKVADPIFGLPSFDNIKLYAQVALLQKQVSDLQAANENIVQRVRDKTSGHIDDLESIIRHTGLNPEELKKDMSENHASRKHGHQEAEGGPYIPVDSLSMVDGADEMFDHLDELEILRHIVSNLPLAYPIKHGEEQSPFGRRIDPFNGHLSFHSGLDISGPSGSKIFSTADGKITAAGRNGAYGNAVDIDHGFGISTRYGHMSEVLVQEGQLVHKGDVIGIQGSTGRSTGAHVHYEVRYHDQPLNPRNFLNAGRDVSEN